MVVVTGRASGSGGKGKPKGNLATPATNKNKGKTIANNKKDVSKTKQKTESVKIKKKKEEPKTSSINSSVSANKSTLSLKGSKQLTTKKGQNQKSHSSSSAIVKKLQSVHSEDMVTSTNGPRIQAQRKFAQAGNIYSGTLHINSTSSSPATTPLKKDGTPLKRSHDGGIGSAKKMKKPPFSPPPFKRPKTEDFLTFLCVRGTPALPPELNFFNFPQINEPTDSFVPKKKNGSYSKDAKNTLPEINSHNCKNFIVSSSPSSSLKNDGIKTPVAKEKENGRVVQKSAQKTPNKVVASEKSNPKKKSDTVPVEPPKEKRSTSTGVSSSMKAENPTKGIRATASSVLFSKLKKTTSTTKTKPVLSPPRSRLNEQEARYAMTALKLKYQRLAHSKPNRSLLLTKKVKDKSIILTRSKARSVISPKAKNFSKKAIPKSSMKSAVISPSRNAPSPDIIFGVSTIAARKKASKSSSESEEKSTDSAADSNSSEESDGEEEKTTKPVVRSLRSGKELTRPKSPVKITRLEALKKKKKALDLRRVGTRSAQRITKSPFRELPMYNLKTVTSKIKKRALRKKLVESKNNKNNNNNSKETSSKSSSSKMTQKESEKQRPSRKTKETAAIFMGLLSKGFITDDEDSDVDIGKKVEADEDSEMGSSSSSETKYLEKNYNASLKRVEQKKASTSKSKTASEIRTRSSRNETSKSKRKESCDRRNRFEPSKARNLRSQKSTDDEKSLRSVRMSKKKCASKSPDHAINRTRYGTPTVGDRKMVGAARKSASITCRRRSGYSSSSGGDDESSSDEISSDEEQVPPIQEHEAASSDEDDESEQIDCNPDSDIEQNASNVEENQNTSDEEKSESEQEEKINSKLHKCRTSNKNLKNVHISRKCTSKNKSSSKSSKMNCAIEKKIKIEPKDHSRRSSVTSDTRSSRNTCMTKGKTLIVPKRERSSSSSSESLPSPTCLAENEENEKYLINRRGSGSYSEDEEKPASSCASSSAESEDEDESQLETPIKIDMATQCDMDEEEGLPPAASITERDTEVQQEREREREKERSKQQAPPRKPDSDDDEVQEIGQVFASSSTIHQFTSHSIIGNSQPSAGPSIGYQHHQIHHQEQFHQQQAQHRIDSIQNQFNPFMPRHQDFYTPLQLTPSPMVHSSIQLVGSTLGAPSFPVTNPLNTLSIPVSVPQFPHLIPHPSTIGYTAGSTFHTATTLQTHIRSVATNLDIPLVRPVVGSMDHSINFMTRGPSIGINMNPGQPLTRPNMGMWNQQQPHHQAHHSQADPSRNHFSAFRVPHVAPSTAQIIHQQSTTVLGMNSAPILPVSIIQPQPQRPQHSGSTSSSQRNSNKQSDSSTKNQNPNNNQSSSNPPGYNIIKNLPNVSIVPKFDRSSKPSSHLPSQEPKSSKSKSKPVSSSSSTNAGDNKIEDNKRSIDEPKKAGRKKKQSSVLPQPLSPLTVRKDTNPATYVGLATKKQCKKEIIVQEKEIIKTIENTPDRDESSIDGKIDSKEKLKMKKSPKEKHRSPAPSCSSSTSSSKTNRSLSTESKLASKSHQSSRNSSPVINSKTKSKEEDFKGDKACKDVISDAPIFRPSSDEFDDPLKYIQKIQPIAEKYGMARIIPPTSFRPECNVEDDMRFTAYNHYIHKMYQRWGPNVLQSQSIKENLRNSQVEVSDSVMIGGMEINLSDLYQTVKSFGGLKEVIEKERWTKVADTIHVPKAAHDRASKLDAIYVKYVLPYEILSDSEREKLKKKVEKRWSKRKDKVLKANQESDVEEHSEDSMDELDECIVKGKTTPLSSYFRVARNTMNIFFPNEKQQTTTEIEEEYWKIVKERNRHVCVYSGSIDCAGVGWGFPIPKASNRHPWNLKVLANNQGSVLRSMGHVMGATVPTLHVSMLFTTYCWYRDPHSLPWVEYLHSGADKIWYSVAAAHENLFRTALTELMPMQCKKKRIWLASDSAMVPPDVLISKGVPLVKAVQHPGEFLVVFPKAYTSAICTGYLISESVCFAYPSWLRSCLQTFKDIRESKEPPVFPLEKLLLSILQDARASLEVVRMAIPAAKEMIKEEITIRKKIIALGVKLGGKISQDSESSTGSKNSSKKKSSAREEEIEQCYNCNYLLYFSMVRNTKTESTMCLKHAVDHFSRHKADIKKSVLLFDIDEKQLDDLVNNATRRCSNKSPEK